MIKYFLILLLFFFSTSVFSNESFLIIRGNSMSPYLEHNQKVKVDYTFYQRNVVLKGEVVIAKVDANKSPIIKFVKGVPGDSFRLKFIREKCNLIVNGNLQKNSIGKEYLFDKYKCKMLGLYTFDYKNKIPKKSYLILGDNPSGTKDSTRFGLIDISAIKAKVIQIIESD